MVVIVMGLPGSGKSYFAGRLAATIQAQFISNALIRKSLLVRRTYSLNETNLSYDIMLTRARQAAAEGANVVLDASFPNRKFRERFEKDINAEEEVIYIEISADESLIRERLRHKREDSDADFYTYLQARSEWEPLNRPHLRLESTDSNIEILLQEALRYLELFSCC